MKKTLKTIGSLVAITAMIVMAASCKKEYLSEEAQKHIPGVERNITVSASLPQTADKAHIDGLKNVVWDFGDALNINGSNVTLSSIQNNGTVAKFDRTTVHANTVSGNDHYWAVYPTTLAGAYSGALPADFTSTTALTVHFPDTQLVDLTVTDTLKGLTYMASHAAVADGTEQVHFQMRNLGAILELDLTPYCSNYSRVDSIVFTSSNASLAGTFTVSDNASNPTITPTAGTNKLVVKFQDNDNKYIDITGGKKVRVILPPLAGKNLNMKIYGNGKRMEKNAASATLVRSRYYTNAINFDVSTWAAPDVVGFSVAPDRRVVFAPGNLQYQASGSSLDASGNLVGGTWRFAPNQWDYVGNARGNTTPFVDRSTQSDWIDLFGWGTSGWNSGAIYHLPYDVGYTFMGSQNDYNPGGEAFSTLTGVYAQADWGIYNAIYNPHTGSTDLAGTWRTPTFEEWEYLLLTREILIDCNTEKMYGHANVNGVNGLVILPDNWKPASCPGFTYGNSAWANNFDETTTPKWSQMEAIGCVFLPAAAYRNTQSTQTRSPRVEGSNSGKYWTSTFRRTGGNYLQISIRVAFNGASLSVGSGNRREIGNSVRLVKDVH